MKFVDLNKRNNPTKLNIIALLFVIIAISGVFLSVNNNQKDADKKGKVEELKKIASDTTIKNIDVTYKTADPGEFSDTVKLSQTSEYTKKFYQTMITVTILFVVFLLVVYLLKKKNNLNFGANDNIKVLDKKYLGQKQYLVTVVIENQRLLLGVTDHSINLIKTLDEIDQKSEKQNDNDIQEDENSFPKILGKLRKNSNEN